MSSGSDDDRKSNENRSVGTAETMSDHEPGDGEYQVLIRSLEDEESVPLSSQVETQLKRTLSGTAIDLQDDVVLDDGVLYGNPLSVEEAKERMPPIGGGLSWNATIVPDDFFNNGKLKRGLTARDFDVENQKIKPRRGSLPLTATDFFSSLTKVDDGDGSGPRYVFYGVLNGWPSLRCFELVSLEERRNVCTGLPSPKELMKGQIMYKRIWTADKEGAAGIEPALPPSYVVCRAKLRGAHWSSIGWSKDSPGFVYWYEPFHSSGPRISYGTSMMDCVGNDKCSGIHMVSHRYAVARESARDMLTYHSVCFLEWEHGRYGTVIELAYLNGIGGYKGKSNWYHDKDEKVTSIYQALPPELICPWKTTAAEIRCFDVEAKNLDEFKEFMMTYNGSDKRFVDPQFSFSHKARLTFRSRCHIAQYLINYITRDSTYGDLKRNCQTFAADFCAFIAGKKNIAPYHPVSRIDYNNRTHTFNYDSHMYETNKKKR